MIRENQRSAEDTVAFLRTMAVCFVSFNLTLGIGYGSFGALLAENQHYFDVSRTAASSGMSILNLVVGLISPLVGSFFFKLPTRVWMLIGVLLSIAAYIGLALARNFVVVLLMYGLIGAGTSLASVLGPLTLVTRWADGARGQVLAIVNLPLMLFISPFLVAELLPIVGRNILLLGIAGLLTIFVPFLFLIVEHPAVVTRSRAAGEATTPSRVSEIPSINLWHSPLFWSTTLVIGLMAGIGNMMVVHLVPFGVEKGMTLKEASGLLATYAGCGVIGNLLMGWLADRLGPLMTLALSNLVCGVLTLVFVATGADGFFVIIGMIGLLSVPVLTLFGAAMAALFGPDLASKAVGFGYAIKLPFMFGTPIIVAAIWEHAGGYKIAFECVGGMFLLAALLSLLSILLRRSPARPAVN